MAKMAEFSQVGGPDVLQIVDREVALPTSDEVQIEMRAAGLNRAEHMFLAGQYLVRPDFPSRIGIEGSGVISAVGANVEHLKIGDEVSIIPTFSLESYGVIGEVSNVPASAVIPKLKVLSFAEAAAAYVPYLTAWGLLILYGGMRVDPRKTVVITAATSSVGIAAIQLIKCLGGKSIAITRLEAKRAQLAQHKPDSIIVLETDDLNESLLRATDGVGYDLAIDAVGGSFLDQLAETAAYEALIMQYGLLSLKPTPIPMIPTATKALAYRGFHVIHDVCQKPKRLSEALGFIERHLQNGNLKPVIASPRFQLEEIRSAYACMEESNHIGKIVVEVR